MKKLFQNSLYAFVIYIIGILFFTIFRIILIFSYIQFNETYTFQNSNLFKAMIMGFRFDTVISCYILILPVLLLCIGSFLKKGNIAICKFAMWWSLILYNISFIFTAANIPYYLQFNKQINASIWNWMSEPGFVLNMMFSELSFIIYIILFFAIAIIYSFIIIKWTRFYLSQTADTSQSRILYGLPILYSLIILFFVFLGIRGRTATKSPIRIGTAYFCNDQFMNQAGLNPMFVLLRSSIDMQNENKRSVNLTEEITAFKTAAKELGMNTDSVYWYKQIEASDSISKKNIVVILMESFCSDLLEWKDRTHFINSLIKKSIYFKNTYSAGIHTMNGIHSTIFGYPALLNQHPLKSIKPFYGMPSAFIDNGYSTMYFTTHDDQFDNVAGFLIANGFENIYAQKDYPKSEVKSNLGVVDDYMLRYAVNKLSEYDKQNTKPFFATMLTASNHQPYIIPEYFTPKEGDIRKKIVEYSDWALSRFFEEAQKQDWYKNTIFVLLGDHGSPAGLNLYDVSLIYHQIPLLIFEPGKENQARTIRNIAGQIDVFPTIMGILGLPYRNETFGIDLLKDKRDYIFFSSDDSYACVDSTFYYINRMDGRESLYNYSQNSAEDSISFYREKAAEMNEYAKTMIQAAQYIIKNK